MQIHNTPTFRFDNRGDLEAENSLVGYAKLRLKLLKDSMKFMNLQQSQSLVEFEDGSSIRLKSCFGIDTVDIYCPPSTLNKQEVTEYRDEYLIISASYNSIIYPTYCFIWDIRKNGYAKVTDDDGNKVQFGVNGVYSYDLSKLKKWRTKRVGVIGVEFNSGHIYDALTIVSLSTHIDVNYSPTTFKVSNYARPNTFLFPIIFPWTASYSYSGAVMSTSYNGWALLDSVSSSTIKGHLGVTASRYGGNCVVTSAMCNVLTQLFTYGSISPFAPLFYSVAICCPEIYYSSSFLGYGTLSVCNQLFITRTFTEITFQHTSMIL